jgi:hypothetical protein
MDYKETFGVSTEIDGTFSCEWEKFSKEADEPEYLCMDSWKHYFYIPLDKVLELFKAYHIDTEEALFHLASPNGRYYVEKYY